ncbi:MAG: hypothetical protein JST42_30830 [Bacteroidetes bacterium]|nr:hypothetical protein [Bacteroidota bacterium]
MQENAANTIGASFQILLLLGFLVPAVVFLLAQQKTLQTIRPEYRDMRPGLVWLQLIPIANLYWMFIVVKRIANSIYRQTMSFQDDSVLGIADPEAIRPFGNRPTYKMGMAYCWCIVVSVVIRIVPVLPASLVQPIIGLAGMVFWIIYWVQLSGQRRRLQRVPVLSGVAK